MRCLWSQSQAGYLSCQRLRHTEIRRTGRHLNRACYDPLAQAESGWCLLQGFPDRPPYYAQQYIGDYLSGLFAVNGILMALRHVDKTGQGQIIDTTLCRGYEGHG